MSKIAFFVKILYYATIIKSNQTALLRIWFYLIKMFIITKKKQKKTNVFGASQFFKYNIILKEPDDGF